jgi:hypothetical protein
MKKLLFLFVFAFLIMPVFCEVVKSDVLTSKYGISYAERQESNYIDKNEYSFRYLGNGTWDVKQISKHTQSSSTDGTWDVKQLSKHTQSSSTAGNSDIVLLIAAGATIIAAGATIIIFIIHVSKGNKTSKGEEELTDESPAAEESVKEYNSYGTNLTSHDVVLAFPGNVLSYLSRSRFYLCNYTVYQGEAEQNYAWLFKIIRNSYKWGTVYTLRLHISNGFFDIKTSTSGFSAGDKSAECYNWTYESTKREIRSFIAEEFKLFVQESLIAMKRRHKYYDVENQKALFYVCTELSPELVSGKKLESGTRQKTYHEIEREVESEAEGEAYRRAYRRAYRKAMYGGWDR